MAKMLMLRLEGVLQSWGEHSRFDSRDSASMPTKSGVVGLLACALGWPRGDAHIAALDRSLRMAVRADRPGTRTVDYQTVTGQNGYLLSSQGTKRDGEPTLVTPRQYLEDACFTVALAGDEALLETCAGALRRPVWQLYLGRKSCVPTRPVLLGLRDFDSLEQAVADEARAQRSRPGPLSCEIETDAAHLDGAVAARYDAVRESGIRYDVRYVRLTGVNPPEAKHAEEVAACT